MIYLFQELDLISNELLHQIIFSMPVARREYVLHFKQPEDQKRSALLGNHFSEGKICRFLISATAEIS